MKFKKIEKIVPLMFFLVGLCFLVIGIKLCYDQMANKENLVDIKGVIEEIVEYQDRDGDWNRRVYVSYEVKGVKYKSELNVYFSSFYEGKQIDIYYDKNNPRKIGSHSMDWVIFLFPGMGLGFALIGGSFVFANVNKKRKEKFLRSNGDVIYAKYVKTILNISYSVNGINPYNIICEWDNPADNKKYIFKSDNIWNNPESIIQERNIDVIPVYINRNKINEYVMDIDNITENIVDLT